MGNDKTSKKATESPPPPYSRGTSTPSWPKPYGPDEPNLVPRALHGPQETQQNDSKDSSPKYAKAKIALHNMYRSRERGPQDDAAKEALQKKVQDDIQFARKNLRTEPNDEAIIKFYGAESFRPKWGSRRNLAFSTLCNKYAATSKGAGRIGEAIRRKVEDDIAYAKERILASEPSDDDIIRFYGAENQKWYYVRD